MTQLRYFLILKLYIFQGKLDKVEEISQPESVDVTGSHPAPTQDTGNNDLGSVTAKWLSDSVLGRRVGLSELLN